MGIIYVDVNYKCHATNPDGVFREVETDFFVGKCQEFIEGYCYDDSKGYAQIYPWKPYGELEKTQRAYERRLLVQYETELAVLRANSIPTTELEAAYEEGVNSV